MSSPKLPFPETQLQAFNPYLYIKIFPNPASVPGRIEVYGLYSVRGKTMTLKLYDVMGREVLDLTPGMRLNSSATIAEARFDPEDLPSGVYLVTFSAGGDLRSEPLVIAR